MLNPEYASVLAFAEEGRLLDWIGQHGLMWYTPDQHTQSRLCTPDGKARTHLLQEAPHDAPSEGCAKDIFVFKKHMKACIAAAIGRICLINA
eukprot:1152455-Pelagomonas_calceolata.AAC.10